MNWKLSSALAIIAALMLLFVAAASGRLGSGLFTIVAKYTPFAEPAERRESSPWFYQVNFDDIVKIEVNAGEDVERFSKNDEGAWVIDRLGDIPPSHNRWGGIVLLLSGPQTRRDFSTVRATIDDPAEYGLDNPGLVVKIGLTGDRDLEFRLGDVTTDGRHHYGQVIGFPQLFLIADTWGEVLARLAHEPPTPKWWIYRDPEIIDEVNIYLGEAGKTTAQWLRIQNEEGEWLGRCCDENQANRPLDEEKLAEYLPLMGGPRSLEVEAYKVRSRDYTDWGIELDREGKSEGHSIEIRFAGRTERGTRFTDGVLFLIGNRTDDGQHYYAIPAADVGSSPILKLKTEWADKLFGLVGNLPYADTDSEDESDQTKSESG